MHRIDVLSYVHSFGVIAAFVGGTSGVSSGGTSLGENDKIIHGDYNTNLAIKERTRK